MALGLRAGRLLRHSIADRTQKGDSPCPLLPGFPGLFRAPTPCAANVATPRRAAIRHAFSSIISKVGRCSSSYTAATVSALIADITAANAAGGANTITLTAPTTSPYVLTAVNNTTYGATGLPIIAANDNLTIVGNGDTIERSTAAGTPDFRLLCVAGGASLTLENLTLQGGMLEAQDQVNAGAGIATSIALSRCIVNKRMALDPSKGLNWSRSSAGSLSRWCFRMWV